jgi:hypothetical protein
MAARTKKKSTFRHKHGYGLLFSNRQFVKELIEGFIDPELAAELDFEQFKPELEKHYVTEDFQEFAEDLVVQVGFKGTTAYLYVLAEFQSTPDRFMALRVLNYLTLFYADWLKDHPKAKLLPPVLPVVLYNGGRRWTAPLEFGALVQVHPRLRQWVPEFKMWFLNERAVPRADLLGLGNALATVFLLEQTTPEEIDKLTGKMSDLLRNEVSAEAIKVLAVWIKHLVLDQGISGNIAAEIESINNEKETPGMFVDTIQKAKRIWRAEGRAEGIRKGLAEGVQKGLAEGVQKGRQDSIIAMHQHGFSVPKIADILGFPESEVRKVVAGVKHSK